MKDANNWLRVFGAIIFAILIVGMDGGWRMNNFNWLSILEIAIFVLLLIGPNKGGGTMKKIFSNLFNSKKKELDSLEFDLQTVETLIERLSSKRYDKKYGDAINSLRFVSDSIGSKIKKLKGGNNER